MVLKDHIDHLEFGQGFVCEKAWESKQSAKAISYFSEALYFTRKRLWGLWHPHFHCTWTEDKGRESPECSKRMVNLKEKKKYSPCCVGVQERVQGCKDGCRLNTNFPELHQHMAFTGLIGKAQQIQASIPLRNSAADLASQTWLLQGQQTLTHKCLDLASTLRICIFKGY